MFQILGVVLSNYLEIKIPRNLVRPKIDSYFLFIVPFEYFLYKFLKL